MGRKIVGKMRGMTLKAKAALTVFVTIAVSVGMYWYLPMRAQANIVTYYLNPYTATSVGFDGTSNMTAYADVDLVYSTNAKRGLLDTNQPTNSTRYRLYDFSGQMTFSGQEFYRAYGPAYAVDTQIDANAFAEFEAHMVRTGGSSSVTVQLFDYNPADGTVVQIGGNVTKNLNASTTGLQRFNNGTGTAAYFGNSAYKMVAGHRLQVRFLVTANNSQPALLLYANPSNAPSGSARLVVNESTVANLTVSNGSAEPGNITIGPSPNGITSYPVDTFGLQLDGTAYDSITTVNVTMGAGSSQYISKVMITNTDNTTVYGSLGAPTSGEIWTITTTSMPAYGLQASGDPIDYHVRIIPKAHSVITPRPGGSYTITGRITGVTHSQLGTITYSDSGSSTITIDNTSPANPSWGAVNPGNGQVQLNWTNPVTDFAGVVILRNTESVTDEPIEGRTYAAANYIGTAVVVYSGTGTSFTDTTAGNGTGFYYKIFAYDTFGNYSLGSQTGPYTPSNPNKTTPGAPSAIGNTSTSIVVTMPYTGDPNANNTYTVNYRANGAGGWTNHVTNAPHSANPYTTTISGLTVGQQYDVQCIYNDADGINVDPPTTSYSVTITAIDLPVYRTIPGAASASVAGTSTINVEMPYNGDINGNNTYLVEWEDVTVPGVWKSKSGSHSVNPYMTAIAGLSPGKTYNVRMTYQDPDGVSGGSGAVQTENGVTLQSATDTGILHNSQRFPGTTKWGGAWGVDGGQYGAFTCATCHQPSAPNIKAIRGSFSAPEGTLPGGADTAVIFQNVTSMGKDAGGHATSNRVCEACHSQTKFHRYNTAGQSGSLTHFNNKDCTECHPHNRGFRGSCENCHGNPPVTSNTDSSNTTGLVWRYSPTGATNPPSPGAHQRHAVSRAMKCATCHNQNTMPEISTTIQMGFAAYSANVPGFKGNLTFGNFSGRSPLANGYSFVASSGGTTVTTGATYRNSCSVACHGNWSGSNGTVYRPSWVAGASQAACGACHGATAAQAPTRGSHVKHASNAAGKYGFGCIKCHPTVADNAHVNGNVQWALNSSDARITGSAQYRGANSGGTLAVAPSGTYGQCTNLYCHSNGLNAASPTYGSPTWGTTLDCTGCHGSKATMATGSHGKHLVSAECANCHNVTITSGSTSISDLSLHVNKSVNMQFPAGATLGAGATYGGSSMPLVKTSTGAGGFTTCSNVKCHNDGTGVWTGAFVAKTTPTWGQAGGCDKCHGNATYTDYRKAAPLYADGSPKPNAHTFHVDKRAAVGGAGEIHCADCHSSVTSNNTTINGSDPADHANNVFNITQGAGAGTYFDGDNTGNSTAISVVTNWGPSPGVSNCVNVSCHPVGLGKERGTSQVNWNTKYKCIDCHSIGMDSTDTFHHAMRNYSTSYPTAAPDGNSTSGTNASNRRCTMCHVDHDKFSPLQNPNSGGRAYNLRTGIGVTPTANSGFTNSDFVKDGTGGICISCHNQAKTKDTDRRRNDTGVTVTPVITYRNYTGSAHNYNVPAKMLSDGSIVNGNCSKCHNALQNETSLFMNITTAGGSTGLSFGNHNSGIRRLQGALGAAGGETAEEQVCYRCHSPYNPNESPGGGPTKPVSGKDYYGGQPMIAAAENIYLNMKNAGSRTPSPTSSYTNKLFFKPGATQTDYMGVSYPQAPMPDSPANDGDQGDTFSGGSYIIRSMSPWDPTVSYASDIKSVTSTLSGLQRWEMAKFVSPAVAAPATVPAGSWVINIYSRESSTSLNARVRYTVYKWAEGGADSKGTTIIAKGTGATELSTTAAPGVNRQISINVPATSLSINEKIVVDLALETNEGTTSGSRTGYFYFGMGAPSNLTLPGYVSWTYGDPGTNGFGHAAGAYAGIHKPSSTDETLAFISANRHVECGDCHNPHAVKGGASRLHTKGSSVLAGVLREVSGAVPNYSSAVASTYYFTNGSPASPPGASQSTDAYGGGTFQVKDMSTSRGGGSVNQVATTNPVTLGTNFRGTAFISPALSAGGVPGGTWTINMTSIESNTAANVALKGYIYLWKSNNTKVAIAGPTTSTEVPTTKGNRSWTLTGSAVAVSAGDRLAVEVYPTIITANSGLTTYTGTMYWNGNVAGTDDSNVVTPTATGIWVPPVSYTQQTATAEYQICFKCHSGANSNYASWGGSGPLAWTDVGLEFSTQNKAAHPVMAALNTTNFPNSAGLITSTKMQTGWTATGTQIMTCSDCHASSAGGSMGPHGSAVRWMLAGTNKAWPFTSATFNGTDGTGATTFKLGTISTNSGTDNGLFCLNCHKVTATSNTMHDNAGNGKHGWQSSARGACVSCHIRVPHGGKIKRLMRSTNTPARYMPNANGGEVAGQSQEVIRSYNGGTSFDDAGCGEHTGGSDTW